MAHMSLICNKPVDLECVTGCHRRADESKVLHGKHRSLVSTEYYGLISVDACTSKHGNVGLSTEEPQTNSHCRSDNTRNKNIPEVHSFRLHGA